MEPQEVVWHQRNNFDTLAKRFLSFRKYIKDLMAKQSSVRLCINCVGNVLWKYRGKMLCLAFSYSTWRINAVFFCISLTCRNTVKQASDNYYPLSNLYLIPIIDDMFSLIPIVSKTSLPKPRTFSILKAALSVASSPPLYAAMLLLFPLSWSAEIWDEISDSFLYIHFA